MLITLLSVSSSLGERGNPGHGIHLRVQRCDLGKGLTGLGGSSSLSSGSGSSWLAVFFQTENGRLSRCLGLAGCRLLMALGLQIIVGETSRYPNKNMRLYRS